MASNKKHTQTPVSTHDGYQDNSTQNVITKSDLNKMTWRSLFLQASFNYERMQACGWLYGLSPALKKIHTNKKDLSDSMKDHMEFFNTHPFLVTFIMGLVTAMEESKQDRSTIRAVKVATMGPLGGIGDALFWLTALPICVGIGASMGRDGNIAGPFIFLVLFNVLHFFLRFFLMDYGYKTGVKAVANMKEQAAKISHAAAIIGLTVVGGLIASMVNLKTTMVLEVGAAVGESAVRVQEQVLDAVMPNMLGLGYTFLMYFLLKKGWSPIKLIGLTVIIGILAKGIELVTNFAIL